MESGYRVPVGGENFHTHPYRHAAHQASYTSGIVSVPPVQQPQFGVDQQFLSSAKDKLTVELNFYSASRPLWPV